MNDYALDTNIISFMLRGNQHLQRQVCKEINSVANIIIPPIVCYEIKRGLIASGAATKLVAFEQLCNTLGVDAMDFATLDVAMGIYATLKKAGQIIDDSDILIAATCIAHSYTLVSDNTRHFKRIKGLRLVSWVL